MSVAGVGTMIARNILPRALEHLAVIEADAPVQALLSEVENEDELLRDYIARVTIGKLRQATIVISDINDAYLRRQRIF